MPMKTLITTRSTIYAAAALLAAITDAAAMDEAQRASYHTAIVKAVRALMEGIQPERDGDVMLIPSATTAGLVHRVHGQCSCAARGVCWHRAARRLVELIEDAEECTLAPARTTLETPKPRAAERERATREMDELFAR